jgi:hypothetical protein
MFPMLLFTFSALSWYFGLSVEMAVRMWIATPLPFLVALFWMNLMDALPFPFLGYVTLVRLHFNQVVLMFMH